jgi:hypothetical protein
MMDIDSAGKVGIGTTSPGAPLEVGSTGQGSFGYPNTLATFSSASAYAYDATNGNYWGPTISISNTDTSGTRTGTGIRFVHRSSSSGVGAIISTSDTADRGDLRFITRGTGNAVGERMIIDYDGNVGIGTNNPATLLTLNGQGTSPVLSVQRSGETTEQWKFIMTEGSAYTTARGTVLGVWTNVIENKNSNMVLSTDDSGGTGGTITIDSDTFYINGVCLPSADNSQDLGSASKRWANLYIMDMELNNVGSGGNEVDGTEGNWSLQEGEENLYVINRKTGKKFKIKLEEM